MHTGPRKGPFFYARVRNDRERGTKLSVMRGLGPRIHDEEPQ